MLNSTFPLGAVAQLGERLHGMQEVVSSNLIGSIFVTLFNLKGCEETFQCRRHWQFLFHPLGYLF